MQYFLWTLEVLQGDGNREKPGTRMWGYLCVSVFQMATICIKENWEIALSEKVSSESYLHPRSLLSICEQNFVLFFLLFKIKIDDVALILKNLKFVCQVFNFEELNKVINLKILFDNLSIKHICIIEKV